MLQENCRELASGVSPIVLLNLLENEKLFTASHPQTRTGTLSQSLK